MLAGFFTVVFPPCRQPGEEGNAVKEPLNSEAANSTDEKSVADKATLIWVEIFC